MEKLKKPIIVPWGLTPKSEVAFLHALNIAKAANTEIALVRLAKNDSLVSEIERDLNEVADDLLKKYGVRPHTIVTSGDMYNRFTEVAEEHESNLIIKHTNPITGMEKIMGSKTMKIIAGSTVPYIVIQEPPKRTKIERIILPLDHTVETKEKLIWLVYFSRFCQPFVHIITPSTTDNIKGKYIKNNVGFVKKILDEKQMQYDVTTADSEDFGKSFVKFAKDKDADLIIIMLPKEIGFGSLLFGSKEQEIMSNEYGIPVMCVNPRTDLKSVAWK